eukprot:7097950-Prymnesium_polylepis.2
MSMNAPGAARTQSTASVFYTRRTSERCVRTAIGLASTAQSPERVSCAVHAERSHSYETQSNAARADSDTPSPTFTFDTLTEAVRVHSPFLTRYPRSWPPAPRPSTAPASPRPNGGYGRTP